MIRSFALVALGAVVLVGIADYFAPDTGRQFFDPRLNVVLAQDGEQVRAYLPEEAWCQDRRIIKVFDSSWFERETWCKLHHQPERTSDQEIPPSEVIGWIAIGASLALAAVVVIPLAVLLSGVLIIMYYGLFAESYLWAAVGAIWELVVVVWFNLTFLDHEELVTEESAWASEESESAPSVTWGDWILYVLERSVHWLEHSQWTNGWRYWVIAVVAAGIYSYFKYWT